MSRDTGTMIVAGAVVLALGTAVIGDDPLPLVADGEAVAEVPQEAPVEYVEPESDVDVAEVDRAAVIACLKACKSGCDRFAPAGPARAACYAGCVVFCWQFL